MMNRIYTFVATMLLVGSVAAQTQDTLLQRQLDLQRDFNPTLMDATKINSLPALHQPNVKKANTNFSDWAGKITPPLEIALPQASSVMTEIPYNTKKGYLTLVAGNYANVDGALGYRLLDTEKNKLAFNFLHRSTNGDVTYNQVAEPQSHRAFMMDNAGRLDFTHNAEKVAFGAGVSYAHSMFNYYGNPFASPRLFADEKQTLGVLGALLSLESIQSDIVNYKASVDFKNFRAKYLLLPSDNGLSGNQVDARLGLDKPFADGDYRVGVDGRFMGAFYGDKALKNYLFAEASPYVRFEGVNWMARLGADVLFQIADNNKIRVAPHVNLLYNVTDYAQLYANIGGGFGENTFLNMMNESRYINPWLAATTHPSFSLVDLELGAKIGEVSGFRFDIFGGYKATENDHLLVTHRLQTNTEPVEMLPNETLAPIYADVSRAHIGAMIQNNSWSPLDLSVRLQKNFYTVKNPGEGFPANDIAAYNKPGFVGDVRASLSVIDKLALTLNYQLLADRKALDVVSNSTVNMATIHDLNVGASYQLTDFMTLSVKGYNLMNQHYDIWYGYPSQGIHVMGCVSFQF